MSCPASPVPAACPCPVYSKQGLCDWPYKNSMKYDEIRNVTVFWQDIDDLVDRYD